MPFPVDEKEQNQKKIKVGKGDGSI